MSRPLTFALTLGVTLALAASGPAHAACPLPAAGTAALSSRDDLERFAFLQKTLAEQSRATQTWTWVWFGINAGVAVASFATLPLTPRDIRPASVVGGIASALSATSYFVFPVTVAAPVAAANPNAPTCEELARAEAALMAGAASEAAGRSWFAHVLAFALSAVPALVVGLAYRDWLDAGIIFVGGEALTEIGIWTQPTGALRGLGQYRAATSCHPRHPCPGWLLAPRPSSCRVAAGCWRACVFEGQPSA